MFARLHDLPRALEARTYAGEGSVVLEVVDPERPEGPERVLLDAGPDGARCTSTERSPDLTVHLAALSGAYLGGTPLSRIAIGFGGADEGSAGRPGARRAAVPDARRTVVLDVLLMAPTAAPRDG